MLFNNLSSVLFLAAGLSSIAQAAVPSQDGSIVARQNGFRQGGNRNGGQSGGFRNGGKGQGGKKQGGSGFKNGQGSKSVTKSSQNNGKAKATTTRASQSGQTAVANSGKNVQNSGGQTGSNSGQNNGQTGGSNNVFTLDQSVIQSNSDKTGQNGTDTAAGQVNSATDPANFINFCKGKTLTNGLQVKGGSCNGIVMGDIPASTNMVSSMVLFPALGDDLQPNTTFDIKVFVQNLNAGSFTNAQETYYSAPQQVGSNGNIIGHCHVTVQDLGGTLNPQTPPNPALFAFFKGINDAGDGQGHLSATVTGGLAPGFYRICTMNSASNHQPVLMPVAQRGTQDDCTKFTVGQGKGNNGGQNNGGGNTGSQNGGSSTGSNTGGGQAKASTTAAASGSKQTGNRFGNGGSGKQRGQGNGGQGRNGGRRGRKNRN